jgi:hypothetical protein
MATTATLDPAVLDSPEYWVMVLLRAMRESDLASAGDAQERLRELGIDMRFPRALLGESKVGQ